MEIHVLPAPALVPPLSMEPVSPQVWLHRIPGKSRVNENPSEVFACVEKPTFHRGFWDTYPFTDLSNRTVVIIK